MAMYEALQETPATQRDTPSPALPAPIDNKPGEPSPPLAAVTSTPNIGDTLVAPRELWPREQCSELGGQGWRVTVLRVRGPAAL